MRGQTSFMGKLVKQLLKPPKKVKNIKRRSREYLTPLEIDKLTAAAKQIGRYGLRDATLNWVSINKRWTRYSQPSALFRT